jgi:hypothetical protein
VDQQSSAEPCTLISTRQASNAARVIPTSTSGGLKKDNTGLSGRAKMKHRATMRFTIGVCVCALSVFGGIVTMTTARADNYVAQPAKTCGRERAKDYYPTHEIIAVAVRGASCSTARAVLKRYYGSKRPCQGSGCTRTDQYGWNCDTNSGDVQQRTGVITVCTRRHAVVHSEVP